MKHKIRDKTQLLNKPIKKSSHDKKKICSYAPRKGDKRVHDGRQNYTRGIVQWD